MIIISDLTYKMVAYPEAPVFDTDECVDWAFEMVTLGYESPMLLILAGLPQPTNYFQTIGYLKECLKELQLAIKEGEQGVICYNTYFVRKIAKGENVRDNLTYLSKYTVFKEYEKIIFDFYLLYWAWDDLDYGINPQEYWPTADLTNIGQIVYATAVEWLRKHEIELTIKNQPPNPADPFLDL